MEARHYPEDRTIFNSTFRQLKHIQEPKNEAFQYFLSNLSPDEDSNFLLWKATRKFKRPTTYVSPLREANGT